MTFLNRLFKIIKYFIIVFIIIIILIYLFIQTGFFKSQLKQYVVKMLKSEINGDLKIEKIEGNLFTKVILKEVRIVDADEEILNVESISISYSIINIINGKLFFSSFILSKPYIRLIQDVSGSWNFEKFIQYKNKKEQDNRTKVNSVSFIADNIKIEEGNIYLSKQNEIRNINIDMTASLNIARDDIDINIKKIQAKIDKPKIEITNLSGNISKNKKDLIIRNLHLETKYSKLKLDGRISNLSNPIFDLQLDCPTVSLKDFGLIGHNDEYKEVFSSRINISGSLDKLEISQIIEYKELKVSNEIKANLTIPDINIYTNIRNLDLEILSIFGLSIDKVHPKGEINLDVKAQIKGKSIDELISAVTVNILPSTLPNLQILNSTITLNVVRREIYLKGMLNALPEDFDFLVQGYLGRKVFSISKFNIRHGEAILTSEGTIGLRKNDNLNIKYDFKNINLGYISNIFAFVKIIGEIDISGELRGKIDNPVILILMEGKNISYKGMSSNSLKINAQLSGFEFPPKGNADIEALGFEVDGYSFDRTKLNVKNNNDIINLDLEVEKDRLNRFNLSAYINNLSTKATSVHINRINITVGANTWTNKDSINAEFTKKQILIKSLKIFNENQEISIKGKIGNIQDIDIEVQLKAVNIDIFNIILKSNLPLQGFLSANLKMKGNYAFPEISGILNLYNAALGEFSFNNMPINIKYAKRNLELTAYIERDNEKLISLTGKIPIDLSLTPIKQRILYDGLNISLETKNLNLNILSLLSKQIYSSGNLNMKLSLRGNPISPNAWGTIDIINAKFYHFAIGTEYRDINSHIVINDSIAIIDSLILKSGEGNAELSGRVFLKNLDSYKMDINLICKDFRIMSTNIFSGDVNSNLVFKNTDGSNNLGGSITVIKSEYNIPTKGKIDIGDIEFIDVKTQINIVKPKQNKLSELFREMNMNIAIFIPGRTWIYGKGIVAEVEGNLRLIKENSNSILIFGEITAIRGSYTINRRIFTINEGKIVFTGIDIKHAFIEVIASGRVSDIIIEVILSGTIENPAVSFRSDPPMEQSDIISYMIFGTSSDKLLQSEKASLKGSSFNILVGFAEQNIEDFLGKRVDVITLQPSQGIWGVGKYITDKLFVKYEWMSSQDESPQTILNYRLNKFMDISSKLGNQKTSGMDMFFRFGY